MQDRYRFGERFYWQEQNRYGENDRPKKLGFLAEVKLKIVISHHSSAINGQSPAKKGSPVFHKISLNLLKLQAIAPIAVTLCRKH